MQRISIILVSVVTSAAYSQPTATTPALAASPIDRVPTKSQLTLTWHLAKHVRESYSGWNSLTHIGAVGATYLLSESGVDADVQAWSARRNETLSIAASVPALIGGFFVPVAVPLYMMRSDATHNGGMAAQQAVCVSFTVTTLLKALTGRSAPDAETPRDVDKRSRRFRYGFLRGGIIHGWPSGHTMSNMALAASLSSYFNDSKAGQVLRLWLGRLCHGGGDLRCPRRRALAFRRDRRWPDGLGHWHDDRQRLRPGLLAAISRPWPLGTATDATRRLATGHASQCLERRPNFHSPPRTPYRTGS